MRKSKDINLHIHEFGGLVDSHREAVLPLSRDQQLLQGLTHRLHPAEKHSGAAVTHLTETRRESPAKLHTTAHKSAHTLRLYATYQDN